MLCSGCPQEGSRENTEVREAAQAAVTALSSRLNNTNYFALDSIVEVKTQVVAGTNYLLTVVVGESDCPLAGKFSEEECVINLEHNNNLQCRVVVYRPLPGGGPLALSQHVCTPVPVSPHVRANCNRKCRKEFAPVCGSQRGAATTFLNRCLMEAAACIARTTITLVAETTCELEAEELEEVAGEMEVALRDAFPSPRRWAVSGVGGGVRREGGGVTVKVGLRETTCLKTARQDLECGEREGVGERRCEVEVEGRTVGKVECEAGVVTACDQCSPEEVEVAKVAVRAVTSGYRDSKEWALQHLAAASTQVSPADTLVSLRFVCFV